MCNLGRKVLIALSLEEGRHYAEKFAEYADVRTATVYTPPFRVEGLRVSGVYVTPAARRHADWPRTYDRLRRSYQLCRQDAPRVV